MEGRRLGSLSCCIENVSLNKELQLTVTFKLLCCLSCWAFFLPKHVSSLNRLCQVLSLQAVL